MRQAVKSLFVSEIMNRDFTPVIASHNMRELEEIFISETEVAGYEVKNIFW